MEIKFVARCSRAVEESTAFGHNRWTQQDDIQALHITIPHDSYDCTSATRYNNKKSGLKRGMYLEETAVVSLMSGRYRLGDLFAT